MNRRTVLILGIALVLVGFVGFYLTSKKQGANDISQQYSVPASFSESAAYGTNAVVFSDSHELVEYLNNTGYTHNLSSNVGLNNIDTVSVSPNNNYILFHDTQVTQSGTLATQLKTAGLDPTASYWWLYNVQSNTFKPLPQDVLLAKVDNTKLYALSSNSGSESITTYDVSTLQQSSTISISGSTNFYPANGGFLLQSPDNEVSFTTNGVVSTELYKSSIVVGVSTDTNSVLIVTTTAGTRLLNIANLSTNKITTIAAGILGAPVWQQPGIALYNTTQGNLYEYTLATNKVTQWKLQGDVTLYPPNITLDALAGPTAAIVSGQQNNAYLIGSGLASPKNF